MDKSAHLTQPNNNYTAVVSYPETGAALAAATLSGTVPLHVEPVPVLTAMAFKTLDRVAGPKTWVWNGRTWVWNGAGIGDQHTWVWNGALPDLSHWNSPGIAGGRLQ